MADVRRFAGPTGPGIGLAALISAATGMLILLERASPRVEVFSHVAPLALGAALFILAITLVLRSSHLIIGLALGGALAPAWLIVPELVAAVRIEPRPASDAPRLRILSANVWSANENHEVFEALIRREQPDIIVVQEASRLWTPTLEGLAPDYQIQADDSNHRGLGSDIVILSKFRLLDVIESDKLETSTVLLELPARFGGGAIEVMGVHIGRPTNLATHRAQLARIAAITELFSARSIVAGDFNATPWSRALRDLDEAMPLERRTRALFSWPTPSRRYTRWRLHAPAPVAPIDHIYAGRQWQLVEIRRGPNIGSDHYPIVATFVLAPS